ncbi:uncharacterized protein H6S33_004048 [Morchella sextelata]|uniref:uncharacterized protein n=1 Tax=Morchella sextelata TaxID=1174677 RepID=UPI001D0477D6|nr:uncharacterized protein H6S33_004048 [Morchella sextelata]KAH0606387.1 hypothetical protein H6S33_004048 [Morchella sextelata]
MNGKLDHHCSPAGSQEKRFMGGGDCFMEAVLLLFVEFRRGEMKVGGGFTQHPGVRGLRGLRGGCDGGGGGSGGGGGGGGSWTWSRRKGNSKSVSHEDPRAHAERRYGTLLLMTRPI